MNWAGLHDLNDPSPTPISGTPEKVFWRSKGFWGPVIALFAMLSDMRGWGSVDQAALLGFVDQVFTYGGISLAFWGRVLAKERLVLRMKR